MFSATQEEKSGESIFKCVILTVFFHPLSVHLTLFFHFYFKQIVFFYLHCWIQATRGQQVKTDLWVFYKKLILKRNTRQKIVDYTDVSRCNVKHKAEIFLEHLDLMFFV